MVKLLKKYMKNCKKYQFKSKKIPGCFNILPCGSGKKYKHVMESKIK